MISLQPSLLLDTAFISYLLTDKYLTFYLVKTSMKPKGMGKNVQTCIVHIVQMHNTDLQQFRMQAVDCT